MTRETIEKQREIIESELMKNPELMTLVLERKRLRDQKKIEEERQRIMSQVAKVISMAADRLGEVQDKSNETTVGVMGEFTKEVAKIEKALKKLGEKEDRKAYEELKAIRQELKAISGKQPPAPVVHVAAPEIPETRFEVLDQTRIVQETKYQEQLVKLVSKLIEIEEGQKQVVNDLQRVKIANQKLSEAIPVQIVDKKGKRIQDLTDVPRQMTSVGGSGAGLAGDLADLDSDSGSSDNHNVVSIGLPASGGHVVGGTTSNPFGTKGATKVESGTGNTNGQVIVGSTDVSDYRWISVQLGGTFNAQVSFEGSNNDVTWSGVNAIDANNSTGRPQNFAGSSGIYYLPVNFRYFRLRILSYTSGTVAATVIHHTYPSGSHSIGINGSIEGNTNHGQNDVGSPVGIGFNARTTNPTAVSDAQRVRGVADDLGRQVVVLNHVRDLKGDRAFQLTTNAETTVLAAGGVGVFRDLTAVVVANTSAAAITVTIRSQTGGASRLVLRIPADSTVVVPLSNTMLQTTANNPWTGQSSSATGDAETYLAYVDNI